MLYGKSFFQAVDTHLGQKDKGKTMSLKFKYFIELQKFDLQYTIVYIGLSHIAQAYGVPDLFRQFVGEGGGGDMIETTVRT